MSAHINSVLFLRWHIYATHLHWALHVWPQAKLPLGQESDSRCQRTGTHTHTHIDTYSTTQPYLEWGTSMLEETTLRFCSNRDTDRVSGSRPRRLLSASRCSSTTSGLREPPSTLWPCGAPLLKLCWKDTQRGISEQRIICTSRKNEQHWQKAAPSRETKFPL